MSLFDQFMKQAASILNSSKPEGETDEAKSKDLFHGVVELLSQQGLFDLLEKLKEKGLGEIVNSWIGHGGNLPISTEQLQHGLGHDVLEKLAAKVGLPVDQTTALLSHYLPQIVDKLTPEGVIKDEPAAAVPTPAETDNEKLEG